MDFPIQLKGMLLKAALWEQFVGVAKVRLLTGCLKSLEEARKSNEAAETG